MKTKSSALLCAALFTLAGAAHADLYVYPQKGQSPEQTDRDKYECYNWAKRESGFDPMATPRTTTPAPKVQKKRGGVIKGAAAGAIAGKVLGSSNKTTKRAAALGAAAGGLRQGRHNRQQEQQKENWEQQEAGNYAAKREGYNRAYSACLEGRGYSVK